MTDTVVVIAGLALGTFAIRLAGVLLGQRIPTHGGWARALEALPGSLIVALVGVSVLSGGPAEWGAGIVALGVAVASRNLPLTMAAGIVAAWALRHLA